MRKIAIVTGNPGKVQELQAIAMGALDFEMREINLSEIQSLDLHEIIEDKVRRAYDVVQGPVIVDHVKIFCIAAYYDGDHMLFGEGILRGTVVRPRGHNGFGFDSVVQPEGENRTMAQMSREEKIQISHRGRAFRSLLEQIEKLQP